MSLNRRSFLSLMALSLPLWAHKPTVEMTVLLDEEIGTISPLIYGHFTEHIGRLIYEGIWVGADSPISNRNGYRLDTLRALERVRNRKFTFKNLTCCCNWRWVCRNINWPSVVSQEFMHACVLSNRIYGALRFKELLVDRNRFHFRMNLRDRTLGATSHRNRQEERR